MNTGTVSIIGQGLMTLYIIWILFKSNAEITEKCKDIIEILKEGRDNLTEIGNGIEQTTKRILAKDENQKAN